ncbi:universal stress protein [Maribrevibacterium harenarium]|uniref:Universal stress protein n=1 Tax=Maribrevibacterium harenarium TaxID=2589817 RepID=A0A501WQ22_9GAMM|nr:universal stress protein [Maribrevibacterium harenarium]TPE49337.1 universal stress protein [Maribrevibacterium harenarium]
MLPKVSTILYACDLDGKTNQAMELVMNLAIANQAKVIIMHAMEPIGAQAANMIHNYMSEKTVKAMRDEAEASVQERMQKHLADFIETHKEDMAQLEQTPETVVVHGIPADAIQKAAEKLGADMIVMNSRTHSRIGQMVIGSTANKVVHHSRVPVLVVPIH